MIYIISVAPSTFKHFVSIEYGVKETENWNYFV